MNAITAALHEVLAGTDLSDAQMHDAMDCVMEGQGTPAQIAAFIIALKMKGETVDEIVGAALSMRSHARMLPGDVRDDLVDVVGTGGDGANTFNISTAAAFVTAAAGVPVAKHGNRAVTSRCGSADVLEALGGCVTLTPDQAARCLETIGICFLYAPEHHPAMRHAAQARRDIGVRTIFNVLGPLTNPAGARRQVVGVYSADLLEPMAQTLQRLGCIRALVVHGQDGLDEFTLCGPSMVCECDERQVRSYQVTPESVGCSRCEPAALAGGDAAHNAGIIRDVFAGMPGPQRDIVCLNAGSAILVGGRVRSLAEGVRCASATIDSGAAARLLDAYLTVTKRMSDEHT